MSTSTLGSTRGWAQDWDCVVVGAGPVGATAALALARQGLGVALIGTPPASGPAAGDGRTAALFEGSISLLRALGVWPALETCSAPLVAIRLVDDTGGLLRAPEVVFRAGEIGLARFGWNVPNHALAQALWATAREWPEIAILEGEQVVAARIGETSARLTLSSGPDIEARLVVAADGRHSVCRQAAGIATRSWDYDQAAITARFSHSRVHGGVSTEFHGPAGPCTTVPLPGEASSLVWVERRGQAKHLASHDDATFRYALETRLQGVLGSVGDISPRHCIELSGMAARQMAARRVALVGEAGHVMPPIGAQGLNLGLRDVAWLADCVGGAVRQGQDPGGRSTLAAYDATRASDVGSRIAGVDALNRSLVSDMLAIDLARGLGLHLLAAVPAFKRAMIRQGMASAAPLPSLMQPAVA